MDEDMQQPEFDWSPVRRAYETSEMTIRQICARHGITKGRFEYHCKKQRWTSRLASKAARRRSTLVRLSEVLEKQVSKLANASGDTLGDKEAQQLTELIKNFEKITTLAKQDASGEVRSETTQMRQMRDKLAKRLEQRSKR